VSTPTIKDLRAAAAIRRQKRQRNRRVLWAAGVSLLTLTVVVGLVLPGVVRKQLELRGSEFLERSVTVERVALNPFSLKVEIEGLDVRDRDGGELLSWRRLHLNANLWSTLAGSWGVDAIELDGLRGRLFMNEDGVLNIADVLEKFTGADDESADEPRPLDVGFLAVTDAQFSLADASRSRPFATTIGPLSFSLADFHTRSDPEAPYTFEASTESGESVSWRGTLSVVPLKSTGDFVVSGVNLPKYEAYFADQIPFEVESGLFSAAGSYELVWTEELPDLKLTTGEISLTAIALAAREGNFGRQTLAAIKLLGVEADLRAASYRVGSIALEEGAIEVRRSAAGFDLMGLALAGEGADEANGADAADNLEEFSVGSVQLERVSLQLRDETLVEPVTVGLNLDSAAIENFRLTDLSAPVSVEAGISFPLGGTLQIGGELSLQPFVPDLSIDLAEVSLLPGATHLQALTAIQLVGGTADLSGNISGGEAGLAFRGDGNISDVALRDAQGQALAGLAGLGLQGIDFRTAPTALKIEAVAITDPEAHMRINADGTINLREIGAGPTGGAEGHDEVATDAALPDLEIGRIAIDGGRFVLRDDSIAPAAEITLQEFAGEMQGWSSHDVARAEVAMTGKINGVSPVSMRGDLNPLGRPAHADLAIEIERMDLMPTSGYVGKYAGYALEEGKLSLEIAFQLRDRRIESDTLTLIDQFTLGAKTDSTDATDLPVKLGVALLKDPAGEIVIDVPVAGDLDDPEFRIGRVVWRVVSNLLVKAATSPFALLGGVVAGGADVDLERHAFPAGDSTITAATRETLTTVREALAARPELGIGIRGEFDPVTDPVGLRPRLLDEALRREAGETAFDAEGAWLQRAREAALVARFEEVFGIPPIDPEGELPPPETVETMEEPAPEPSETDDTALTLVGWLRTVFVGDNERAATPQGPEASPAPASSFPLPESLAPELPVLPMAEIESRLLAEIEVPAAALVALAERRALATQNYLREAGLSADRITIRDTTAGASQVTLDLR
jgi:hypothetical protein